MPLDLNPVETRILGCLLEKERTTPENYPLSLNSLTLACNQSTNRDPVVAWDEKTVEEGVNSLRERKLATVIFGAGSRVQKYRHKLLEHYTLDGRDTALLCVLLLRGAQTPGELRQRTERLFFFPSIEDLESTLDGLGTGESPLVKVLPARPGQKEKRYVQLLSVFVEPDDSAPAVERSLPAPRRDSWADELAAVKADLAALREEFAAFRKQFE